MKERLFDEFEKVFGDSSDASLYFSPGRVNLIGEHTDYNGGHVFPCALTIGTYGVIKKRTDKTIRFYSMNFEDEGIYESSLEGIKYDKAQSWTNYPKGIIKVFSDRNMNPDCGFDMLVYGNIPNGSGLSSSASIEVLMGYILKEEYGFLVDGIELAKIGQYSENTFNGVNCGIMDQFAIAMGKKDHAIFLDTKTLEYKYVPVKLTDSTLLIACSNKKRTLGESKYNERRQECEKALEELKESVSINALGDMSGEMFEEHKHCIKDDIRIKRAKHAVYENERTLTAVRALSNNEIDKFGKLMNESHISLSQDYEVTGDVMDALVSAAWKQEGVIGARITGAGFGGCTVNLVRKDAVSTFIENVGKEYNEKTGLTADFYPVNIGDGPQKLV